MRERIQTRDAAYGEAVRSWREAATVRCTIEPLKQGERVAASRVEGVRTHRIRMRYRPDVSTVQRIEFGSRTFEIDEVLDMREQGRELVAR